PDDGIRCFHVTGVQTCALPISMASTLAARATALMRTGAWGTPPDQPPDSCRLPTNAPYALAMPPTVAPDPQDSSDVVRRLRGGTDLLTSAALKRLDEEIPWYRELAAEDRSWIGLVAQSGIA